MDDAELIVLVPTPKSFLEETILPTVPPLDLGGLTVPKPLHLADVGLTVCDFPDQHHIGDTDK